MRLGIRNKAKEKKMKTLRPRKDGKIAWNIINEFHNTSAIIFAARDPDNNQPILSDYQKKRLKRELCGNKNCTCGLHTKAAE
jgi:hypothetical protein